eukprot:RCo047030
MTGVPAAAFDRFEVGNYSGVFVLEKRLPDSGSEFFVDNSTAQEHFLKLVWEAAENVNIRVHSDNVVGVRSARWRIPPFSCRLRVLTMSCQSSGSAACPLIRSELVQSMDDDARRDDVKPPAEFIFELEIEGQEIHRQGVDCSCETDTDLSVSSPRLLNGTVSVPARPPKGMPLRRAQGTIILSDKTNQLAVCTPPPSEGRSVPFPSVASPQHATERPTESPQKPSPVNVPPEPKLPQPIPAANAGGPTIRSYGASPHKGVPSRGGAEGARPQPGASSPSGGGRVLLLDEMSPKKSVGTIAVTNSAIIIPDVPFLSPDGTFRVVSSSSTVVSPTKKTTSIVLPPNSQRLPDGSAKLPNEFRLLRNGRTILPDGTIVHPNGTVVRVDGTVIAPTAEGKYTLSDGTVLLSDARILRPDGKIVHPDGSVQLPDGSVRFPDGSSQPPGTVVPSYVLPGFSRGVQGRPPGGPVSPARGPGGVPGVAITNPHRFEKVSPSLNAVASEGESGVPRSVEVFAENGRVDGKLSPNPDSTRASPAVVPQLHIVGTAAEASRRLLATAPSLGVGTADASSPLNSSRSWLSSPAASPGRSPLKMNHMMSPVFGSFVSPRGLAPLLPICHLCKDPVHGNPQRAFGKDFHIDCFVCVLCDEPIGAKEPRTFADECLVHVKCAKDSVCVVCKLPAVKKAVKASGLEGVYHPKCFRCAKCDTCIATTGRNMRCFVEEGQPRCTAC